MGKVWWRGVPCFFGLIIFVLAGGLCLGFSNRSFSRKAKKFDDEGNVIIPQDWLDENEALKISGAVLLTIGLLLIMVDVCSCFCQSGSDDSGRSGDGQIEGNEGREPLARETNMQKEGNKGQ